jgi:hypothetical protein
VFWQKKLLNLFKNKIIYNFMILVPTKNGGTKNFPPPLMVLLLDPEWIKIRIRDKHPGSATLVGTVAG